MGIVLSLPGPVLVGHDARSISRLLAELPAWEIRAWEVSAIGGRNEDVSLYHPGEFEGRRKAKGRSSSVFVLLGVAQREADAGQRRAKVGAKRGFVGSEQEKWAKVRWISCHDDVVGELGPLSALPRWWLHTESCNSLCHPKLPRFKPQSTLCKGWDLFLLLGEAGGR